MFDRGETLNRYNLPEKTMFILFRGRVNVQQELNTAGKLKFQIFSRRPKAQPAIPLDRRIVEQVANQLAQYIGPTAFSLAHEKQISSLYWLYQQLAKEIPDPQQREEFLRYCPAAPVEQLQPGDCFGERALFLGETLAQVTMTTVVETELLMIPQDAIAAILEHDHQILEQLSQEFARYQNQYLTQTMQISGIAEQKAEQIAITISNL